MSKIIAERIKEQLKEQNMGLSEFGRRIGTSSQDVITTLGRLEEGKGMTIEKLERIAKALNKEMAFFLN